jgi:hypothetical protein
MNVMLTGHVTGLFLVYIRTIILNVVLCHCESWAVRLSEQLGLTENRVPRNISGCER